MQRVRDRAAMRIAVNLIAGGSTGAALQDPS